MFCLNRKIFDNIKLFRTVLFPHYVLANQNSSNKTCCPVFLIVAYSLKEHTRVHTSTPQFVPNRALYCPVITCEASRWVNVCILFFHYVLMKFKCVSCAYASAHICLCQAMCAMICPCMPRCALYTPFKVTDVTNV